MRDEGKLQSEREITYSPHLFLCAAIRLPTNAAGQEDRGWCPVRPEPALLRYPAAEDYIKRATDMGLHEKCFILIEVGPLASARAARWIHKKIRGIHIPDAAIERLESADDKAPRRQANLHREYAADQVHGRDQRRQRNDLPSRGTGLPGDP